MKPLTEKQILILDFLRESLSNSHITPSVREIGKAVGLKSSSSVQYNLNILEENGYIQRDPFLKRTIRLKGQSESFHQVPLLGIVTAGKPILAVEHIESYLPYSGTVSPDKPLFALKIRGDSMINAGIFNKDIIFAEKTSTADNGDIVVAMIDDEATVKRFFKEDDHYRLQPENDNYDPIIVDKVEILGKVKAILRYF